MHARAAQAASEELTDAEMARRIAGGDQRAFCVLMRRHNQSMFRAARSILKDDAEAEDAVQEAYLLAYRAMGSFRGQSRLSTWLVRIAVNEGLARLRRRSRRAEVIRLGGEAMPGEVEGRDADEPAAEQPDQLVSRLQARCLLEGKIDQLPETFRTVFMLRAIEEMSVDETAACLGIPPATVRSRFFRARALLRESLSREIDFAFEDAFSFAGDRCDRIVHGTLQRLAPRPDSF